MRGTKLLQAAPIVLAYVVGFFSSMIMPVWVAQMSHRYQLEPAQIGLIASIELGCLAIASIATAAMPRRGRWPITLALLVSAAANILSTLAPGPELFALVRIIAGVAHGVLVAEATRRAALTANPPRIFAAQIFVGVVAATAFFSMAPTAIERLGPGAPFLLHCAFALVSLLSLFWLESSSQVDQTGSAKGSQIYWPPVVLILAGIIIVFANQASMWTFLSVAADRVGMPLAKLSTVLAIGSVINLLAPFLSDWMSRRMPAVLPFILGFGGVAVARICVAGQSDPTIVAVGAMLLTFPMLLLGPPLLSALVKLDPAGRIAAVGPAFFMVGSAIGPAVGGAIITWGSLPMLAWLGVVALTVSLTLILAGRRCGAHARASEEPQSA